MKDMRCGRKIRKSFSRIDEITEMPNLIEVQKKSYKWFLDEGLRQVFRDVGAITDYTGNLELTFYDYTLEDTPKYSVTECKARDATYAAPLKVRMRPGFFAEFQATSPFDARTASRRAVPAGMPFLCC